MRKRPGRNVRRLKRWEERKKIKPLIARISSSLNPDLAEKEQIAQSWEKYGEAIRPGLEAADRLQADSIARSFTKVVRI